MKKLFLLAILLIGIYLQPVFGQTIKFDLPANKGKTLYLVANKGIQRDTVFSGQISEKGELVFAPSKDNPLLSGVVSLVIKPDIQFDFIYSSKENSTLHCEEELVNNQNSHFHNSPDNDFITTNFTEQMRRQEKIMFCEQGVKMYSENENLYKALKEEKMELERQQVIFNAMLQKESAKFYSAKLMQIQNLINNYIGRLQSTTDSEEIARIKEYAISHIDIDALFSSNGIWYYFINGLLGLYQKESPFYGQFGNDISALMQRTESQDAFLALANDAFTICSQFGWNTDEITLSKYLLISGRITNPQGKLKQMLSQYKFEPGMPAPKIAVKENQYIDFTKNNTLVIFYESGCSLCDNEIIQLTAFYPILKERGYDVVSIAADLDKTTFENYSKNFPWSAKLCDLKGFAGENFNNYAIVGTPTYFLIDKAGVILGKYATLVEIVTSS